MKCIERKYFYGAIICFVLYVSLSLTLEAEFIVKTNKVINNFCVSLLSGHEQSIEVLRDLTSFGSLTFFVLSSLLLLLSVFFYKSIRELVLHFSSLVAGSILCFLLKNLHRIPRPSLDKHFTKVVTLSFPSAHAFCSALIFSLIALFVCSNSRSYKFKFLWWSATILIILSIGLSRVSLGVHWMSDILGGWLLSGFIIMLHLIITKMMGKDSIQTKM